MLKTPTEFPHQGAPAFLRGSGQPCRIIQRRADGQVTVAIEEQYKAASSTRTLPLTDLAATLAEATAPAKRTRGCGAKRSRAKTQRKAA